MLPKTPIWAKAFNRPGRQGTVLEVPIQYGTQLYTKNGSSSLSLEDLSYLVIGTNQDGTLYAELVKTIPNYDFKKEKNSNKQFSGLVNVEDLQGNLKAQFEYSNGKLAEPDLAKTSGRVAPAEKCIVTDWYTCVSTSTGDYGCRYTETTSTCTISNGGTGGTSYYTGYYYPPTTTGSTGGSSGGGTQPTNPPAGSLEEAAAKNLESLLVADPDALITALCSEIAKWKAVAEFLPPQAVIQKLDQLEALYENFHLLLLENAGGKVVNMDYFPVTVTALPPGMTADSFLLYMRTHINDFVDTFWGEFTTEGDVNTGYNETSLWNSSNPVGTIIQIDIPGDNGTVVCVESTSSRWRFATMVSPWDGDHPVSGTREFGYVSNGDGSYTFYTRGVDRFTSRVSEIVSSTVSLGDTFAGADNLWSSYQAGIESFVDSHGGTANAESPQTYRPDWALVKDVLLGDKPIESLGCK